MHRSLILSLVLASLAFPAGARDVTGQMTYRQRIALPPGSELKLELRGPEGIVAEATISTEDRQVPLPFVIVAPDNSDFRLRGAIFAAGRAEWVSDDVPVPAGSEPLDLGMVALSRHVATGATTRMRCGAGDIVIGFAGEDVILQQDEEGILLRPTRAASGARYSDGATPETLFWSKGNTALVTLNGIDLPECRPMIDAPLLPLVARGNEPFWRLELNDAGFVYDANLGETRREGPLSAPVVVPEGLRFDLAEDLSVTVARRMCRDTMAGMPYPMSVTLVEGGQTLPGCAGAPVALLDGAWKVDHIEGAVLPKDAEVTIVFDAMAGRVFGKSACNRYNAGFTLTGEGLSFGPAAGTMMACPSDLMAVEQTFLSGLDAVDRFDFTSDGALELLAAGRVVIRASRR